MLKPAYPLIFNSGLPGSYSSAATKGILSPAYGSFDVRTLFAGGKSGALFDPSVSGTLFQDFSGTAADSYGDPVRLAYDVKNGVPVLGPELVTNGDFDTDSDWSQSGVDWSIADEKATKTSGATVQWIYQSLPLVAGATYMITYTISGMTGGNFIPRWSSDGAGTVTTNLTTRIGNGTYTEVFHANADSDFLELRGGTTFDGSIDDITVKLIPGLHATAPSDAARPLYARMPRGGKRNLLTSTATMATQNVTTTAQAYTLSFYGTGTVTLSGTSTDGPLVGTGAGDRVTLTFTPSAGTLTLTVSGSVTSSQLETGSSATAVQIVGAGAYDCTESGVPDVPYLLGDGTQYMTIPGSADQTYMHDGTGGDAFGGFVVNKEDDGSNNALWSSRTSTDIGSSAVFRDASTESAAIQVAVSNGTGAILSESSSNDAVPRFTPFVINSTYTTASSPNGAISVDAAVVASGDDTGTPSMSDSTNDITLMANGSGAIILPGGFSIFGFINGLTDTQRAQVNQYISNRIG